MRCLKIPIQVHPHFEPRYLPWEQRLCLAPDGDFFAALHRSNTHVVTGEIKTVTAHGIRMRDGTCVDADVIVMRMKLGGDIGLRIDGEPVMSRGPREDGLERSHEVLDGVPNLVFMLGYTNVSWTLGADDAAWIPLLVRILQHVKQSKQVSPVTPRAPKGRHRGDQACAAAGRDLPQPGGQRAARVWDHGTLEAEQVESHRRLCARPLGECDRGPAFPDDEF